MNDAEHRDGVGVTEGWRLSSVAVLCGDATAHANSYGHLCGSTELAVMITRTGDGRITSKQPGGPDSHSHRQSDAIFHCR